MTAPRDEADLRHWLVDYLVTSLGCSPDDIDFDASFNDLGVGSKDAVVLSGELSEVVGRPISPVEFWEHPTITTLARFLADPEQATAAADDTAQPAPVLDDAIAVIGMGCRFPGGISGPDAYWRFLQDGRSAVSTVPEQRWRPFDDGSPEAAAALRGTTRWGAYLSDVDAFDAEYFDISPSEADRMDPQQRLLLEVSHEALEHAGIPAQSLRHSQTGVFAGACAGEYGYLATRDLSQVDAWSGTGASLSIVANRVSYFFDLRGPSVTIDTACSSSLVAIHLACQSLRSGDANLALAAGVNLMLSPAVTRSFDRAEAMSPTGQCHAFDAAADGFVRGEGCGVVVLKRLRDAQRDGDPVLAVIRGSAVNQDGHSNGLMAPNPAAQMAVLRTAYANAGLSPLDVDYVEAHGTGTLLGDPIEARALGTVLGRGRPAGAPLLIGAVKSNLGHLEAAAGVAGLIKAVLAIQRASIPANAGYRTPNPHIPFAQLRIKVAETQQHWPETSHPRRAGVSSFGFGGTNAHVVLEQAPPVSALPGRASSAEPDSVTTLIVGGKSAQRVAATAQLLADWMESAGADIALPDVAHTLNHHRAGYPVFATVAAQDRDQAVAGLRALAGGYAVAGTVGPHEGACRPGTVFVYSGQGSQWAGMGRQLLAEDPVFAAAVAELEPVFAEQVGFSLQAVLASGEPAVGIDRVQPVLVGMQLALTALWRAHGVEPDAVVGHSMGEVAAAVVAGGLSVADGLKVIATRSRLMARLSGLGAMALLEMDAAAVEELLVRFPDVTVAVHASPRQTVIAGPAEQVDGVVAVVDARHRLARRIDVDVASHHPTVDPILPELRTALADLRPRVPVLPLISTTRPGDRSPVFDAGYWVDNLRNPVRFAEAVAAAGAEHGMFIEVSPHPVLTYALEDSLADVHHHSVATLFRDRPDTLSFRAGLNATHTTRPPQVPHPPEPHVGIPTTPWQHTTHWLTRTAPAGVPAPPGAHRMLGFGVTDPSTGNRVWERRLAADSAVPGGGATYVELVLTAVDEAFGTAAGPWTLADMRLEHPVPLVAGSVMVTTLSGADWASSGSAPARARVEIHSRTGTSGWTRHVTADLVPVASQPPAAAEPMAAREAPDVAVTEIAPAPAGPGTGPHAAYAALIATALQTLPATPAVRELGGTGVLTPTRLAGVRVLAAPGEAVRAVARLAPAGPARTLAGQVQLSGSDGKLLLTLDVDVTFDADDLAGVPAGATTTAAPIRLLWDQAGPVGGDAPPMAGTETTTPARDWPRMPADERTRELESTLRDILARQLAMPPSAVQADRPFPELGLDSMMSMAVLRETREVVGVELSATMLWNHPTVTSLAAHLTELLAPVPGDPAALEDDVSEPDGGLLDALFDSVDGMTADREGVAMTGSESGI